VIEIEYIVKDKQGVERLRTADKKAADAYDKALETADRLAQLLRDERVVPNMADQDLEELTIFLARNARTVERLLKGKESTPVERTEKTVQQPSAPKAPRRPAGQETTAADDTSPRNAGITPLKAAG
jgi:dsDNA-binding SOS-regulon protein